MFTLPVLFLFALNLQNIDNNLKKNSLQGSNNMDVDRVNTVCIVNGLYEIVSILEMWFWLKIVRSYSNYPLIWVVVFFCMTKLFYQCQLVNVKT